MFFKKGEGLASGRTLQNFVTFIDKGLPDYFPGSVSIYCHQNLQ
jgi:hypothetical protein